MKTCGEIHADIVDLAVDSPKRGEDFYVDTCVWLWFAYPPAGVGESAGRRLRPYMAYLGKARGSGARLRSCAINLTELASKVEWMEYKMFVDLNQKDPKEFELKDYRYNCPDERKRVAREIEGAWANVITAASVVAITGDVACLCSVASGFAQHYADASDALAAEFMKKAGMTQVITDDWDFATISGLTVFTANHRLVEDARRAGRLVSRPPR